MTPMHHPLIPSPELAGASTSLCAISPRTRNRDRITSSQDEVSISRPDSEQRALPAAHLRCPVARLKVLVEGWAVRASAAKAGALSIGSLPLCPCQIIDDRCCVFIRNRRLV